MNNKTRVVERLDPQEEIEYIEDATRTLEWCGMIQNGEGKSSSSMCMDSERYKTFYSKIKELGYSDIDKLPKKINKNQFILLFGSDDEKRVRLYTICDNIEDAIMYIISRFDYDNYFY